MTLEFSGGEKVLYDCRVQLEPTAFNFSETHLYITHTRLVFELEEPITAEISEIMELSLESFYGERFIYMKYKDLKGVHTISFVCTGFGGIISNISKTIFVYKLLSRLRDGMHPRDIRFLMSGSAVELYSPWILLAVMLLAPAASILFPLSCWSRVGLSALFFLAYTLFSITDVYKLLLGRLRWPSYGIVSFIILTSMLIMANNCMTVEVMYPGTVYGKSIDGDLSNPLTIWYCVDVKTEIGQDRLCLAEDDWRSVSVGDRIITYYMDGPLSDTIIPYRYDDRTQDYVLTNRLS